MGWKYPGGNTDTLKLFNGLKHLKQLKKLDVSWNGIGDDDVKALVEALKQMPDLHTLDLSSNKIGDAGIKLLAKIIETDRHLTHLQVLLLDWNRFSEAGAKMLAEKVVKLSQLHTLDFGRSLKTYSARALALIHQQKAFRKCVLPSDDTWHHFVTSHTTVVISTLIGGVLFCIVVAFNLNPLISREVGTKPTLPELLKFTCADGRVVNIPVEIATKYTQFGAFLLDDQSGSRVKIMAHKHLNDAEQINTEIFWEWLTGRGKNPVTWATLVEVLRDIELTTLAGDIEAVKKGA